MQTVTASGFSDFRIRGSRFYGFLFACGSLQEAESFLNSLKNEHPAATHHCYAWRINPNSPEEFSQDDGEPSGSAGLPILNTLRSRNLINCLLVSVRYYGGTKLGKKGLIDAYGSSAEQSIDDARLASVIPVFQYKITYPYTMESAISKLKNDFPLVVIDATYLEEVEMTLAVPIDIHNSFRSVLSSLEHKLTHCTPLGESYRVE
ncbi:IMPACT family protein [Rhodohalobacter mucosus]|uniref:IMPACT family protein n=1 Tax=Rhodohalobacter mucosus TaxID=2079485 RepID=UPI001304C2D3|nr:YigZ family protein [Rhodohalobacter mucosus]